MKNKEQQAVDDKVVNQVLQILKAELEWLKKTKILDAHISVITIDKRRSVRFYKSCRKTSAT